MCLLTIHRNYNSLQRNKVLYYEVVKVLARKQDATLNQKLQNILKDDASALDMLRDVEPFIVK